MGDSDSRPGWGRTRDGERTRAQTPPNLPPLFQLLHGGLWCVTSSTPILEYNANTVGWGQDHSWLGAAVSGLVVDGNGGGGAAAEAAFATQRQDRNRWWRMRLQRE